jgi:DNA repair protein SbcC/Rad50
MRIERLRFAGLGPYRGEQQIDFASLEDDGIYLIAGRTGAGKSTILDAICFALYGSVPRFEGGPAHLRSDHAGPDDPTFATVEFTAGGDTYRLSRTPEYERPAKRGGGTTKQAAKATLAVRRGSAVPAVEREADADTGGEGDGGGWEGDGDGWEGLSSSAREIGSLVLDIVGLTREQFLQVILLAQNRFSEFLLAKNDERQKLLRSLFGTQRFDALRLLLVEQRKALGAELETERAVLHSLAVAAGDLAGLEGPPDEVTPAWFDAALAAFAPVLASAETEAAHADEAFVAAEAALAEVRALRALQDRRAVALDEGDRIEALRPSMEALRTELDAARRADAVWSLLVAETAAHAAAEEAAQRETAAAETYRETRDIDEETADADSATIARDATRDIRTITAQLGALEAALAEEARVATAERDAETADAALAALETELATVVALLAQVPAALEGLDAALAENREAAATAETRAARVDTLSARREAALAVTEAVRVQGEREAALARAAAENAAAAEAYGALVTARFAGFAAELATELVPGEPCPVCGAVEHPAPSRHATGEQVTAESLDAASARMDTARRVLDAAQDALRASGEHVAALRTAAGDRGVAELEADLAAAETESAAAVAAVAATRRLEADRRALVEQQREAEAEAARLRSRRDPVAAAATTARHALEALRARVAEQRGDFASVAERAAALTRRLDAATTLVEAAAQARTRADAAAAAARAVDGELAARGLAARAEAERAHRSAGQIERAAATLEQFERQRAAVVATLDERELQDLPTDPVDVELPTLAFEASRTARDHARDLRAGLAERGRRLAAVAGDGAAALQAGLARLRQYDDLRMLADAVDGSGPNTKRMDLEAFVLAARLEQIVEAANGRLHAMTAGRYTLEHDDSRAYRNAASGLGLRVLDGFTGIARQPSSLSGGETFLASLALALGLADVVTSQSGGITLETMFIDEGFGSLDPETLEIAMSTLDGLRAGGRTVGLISHVDAMRERIAVGLRVRVTERGDSVIEAGPGRR